MRLLITVQSVDREGDPLLGFFHGWLLSFAPHFEHIHVICLKRGKTALPQNVTVYSLGKEDGESRVKYIFRFFKHLSELRGTYDIVFSHMNPHYIVLAGWYWKLKKIPILFWRNHAKMNTMTRIAAMYAKKVFYTSPYACTSIFPHAMQMPVGIDTEVFTGGLVQRDERQVLLLGRLSKVKQPELFMEVAALNIDTSIHFVSYGNTPNADLEYQKKLEALSRGDVTFYDGVPNHKTPSIYGVAGVYMNFTAEGSMDKTVLEAAACGAIPLVLNTSFKDFLPEICLLSERDPVSILTRIQKIVNLPADEKEALRVKLRDMVEVQHSLKALTTKFVASCGELV